MTMHHTHSELPHQTKSLLDMENHKKKRENSINGVNNHTVLDMFETHGDDSRHASFQVDHPDKVTKKKSNFFFF